jgi:hypothetical protein
MVACVGKGPYCGGHLQALGYGIQSAIHRRAGPDERLRHRRRVLFTQKGQGLNAAGSGKTCGPVGASSEVCA